MSGFIGRAADLAALARLARGGRRLVTIVGPPGVGKTRLAVEHSEAVAGAGLYREVRRLDASGAADLEGLCALLLPSLGARRGRRPSVEAVERALAKHGAILIVLDNFEHLIRSAAAVVGRWSKGARHAHFIITSRDRLRVAGERVHELRPLPAEEGQRLFLERARLIRGGRLARPDAAIVSQIVQRLDGLPLALELAANRLGTLDANELLARLELSLLSRGRRDADFHHATMRAAIDGSWDLLPVWARSALAQASVFRGGFTLDAAESVIDLSGFADARPTLDAIEALRDASLLHSTETPLGIRFGLYQSIREYAHERLVAAGGLADAERRHAAHFLERAHAWAETIAWRGDPVARRRLDAEKDNLLRILDAALAAAPREPASARTAVRALAALDPVLATTGPFDNHLRWLNGAVAAIKATDPRSEWHARVQLLRGRFLLARGRLRSATRDLEEAREVARELADPGLRIEADWGFAIARARDRRLEEAIGLLSGALDDLGSGPSWRWRCRIATQLGALETERGGHEAARRWFEQARSLVLVHAAADGDARDDALLAELETRRAILSWDVGELDESARLLDAAIARTEAEGDLRWQGFALAVRALVDWEAGRLAEAEARCDRAARLSHQADDDDTEGFVRAVHGALLAELSRPAEAEDEFTHARALLEEAACEVCQRALEVHRGHADVARARQALSRGESSEARAHLRAAERRIVGTPDAGAGVELSARSWERGSRLDLLSPGVRAAVRLLRGALAAAAPATPTAPQRPAATLAIDEQGAWFIPPGASVAVLFGRRQRLRRIFQRLCGARLRAVGEVVSRRELVAAAWPGERMLAQAAQSRLYVAVSQLRRAGLHDHVVTRDDGYLLDESLQLVRLDGPPAGTVLRKL